MRKMSVESKLAVLAASFMLLVGGSVHAAGPVESMRGTAVNAADPAPETKTYLGKRPGTQPVVARTFTTQPPVIPHAVDNFDEITLEENQCLTCHGKDVYQKKNAPMIGESHFLDRDGKKHETASASRHNCVACHVAQVDAPPLVANDFKGNISAGAK